MVMNSNVKILDKRITLIKFQGCSSARMSRERPVEFLIYTCLSGFSLLVNRDKGFFLLVNRDKGFSFYEMAVSQVTYDFASFLQVN